MVNASQSEGSSNSEAKLCQLLEQLHKRPDKGSLEDGHSQSSDVLALFRELKSSSNYGVVQA